MKLTQQGYTGVVQGHFPSSSQGEDAGLPAATANNHQWIPTVSNDFQSIPITFRENYEDIPAGKAPNTNLQHPEKLQTPMTKTKTPAQGRLFRLKRQDIR